MPMNRCYTCAVAMMCVCGCFGMGACNSGFSGAAGTANDESILALLTPTSPGDAARMALDEWNPEERRRGLLLLANAPWGGEDPYMRLYRAALGDGDSAVRMIAIRALAMHGGGEDVALIVANLDDEDHLLRWETVRALQRLHDPDAIDPLMVRLLPARETDTQVRASAADALGQYAEPRVVEALVESLDDPDLAVVRASERSLRFLTGQKLGSDPRDWNTWLASVEKPCTDQTMYEYRAFHRNTRWYEYVNPFAVVPNELPAAPAGMPPLVDRTSERGS